MRLWCVVLFLFSTQLFLTTQAQDQVRVAVLYFENNSLSKQEQLEPLSTGFAEMLITELQKRSGFSIVERHRLNEVIQEQQLSNSAGFDASTASRIGRLLGAQALVLGSFMNSFSDELRMDIRLIEVETGKTLLAAEETDDLEDHFDIVKNIAETITDNLDIQLSDEDYRVIDRDDTPGGLQATIAFSQGLNLEDKGRNFLRKGELDKAADFFRQAKEQFLKAIEISPSFNNAKAKLSVMEKLISEATTIVSNDTKPPSPSMDDTVGPEITIIEPPASRGLLIVNINDMVEISGRVTDESGVRYVKVNHREVQLNSNYIFSSVVMISENQTSIPIVAEDTKGNVSTVQVQTAFSKSNATPDRPRFALVIGNADYESAPLKNPVNDAVAMTNTLRELGFEVTSLTDIPSRRDMAEAIREFTSKITKESVNLFYYAGHGMQINGVNYLIPTRVDIRTETDVEFEAFPLDKLLADLEYLDTGVNLVILDACRDNPFSRSFRSSAQKGLSPISHAPNGTLIAYATSPNSVAGDGAGENGLYTEQLLQQMRQPAVEVGQVFRKVRTKVRQVSDGAQVPWETSSLEGTFYFVP